MRSPGLGHPGPFMVCRECRKPVNAFSLIDPASGEERLERWLHSGELIKDGELVVIPGFSYDHEAVPVEGDPLTAETVCDFCAAPRPRYVFVPRKPIEIRMGEGEHGYGSPWACCEGCRTLVRKRQMPKLIDRAMASPYSKIHGLPAEAKKAYRAHIRELYARFFKSAPAGPYEVRIAPNHSAFGRRGSARGT